MPEVLSPLAKGVAHVIDNRDYYEAAAHVLAAQDDPGLQVDFHSGRWIMSGEGESPDGRDDSAWLDRALNTVGCSDLDRVVLELEGSTAADGGPSVFKVVGEARSRSDRGGRARAGSESTPRSRGR